MCVTPDSRYSDCQVQSCPPRCDPSPPYVPPPYHPPPTPSPPRSDPDQEVKPIPVVLRPDPPIIIRADQPVTNSNVGARNVVTGDDVPPWRPYTWRDQDRIDILAGQILGNDKYYWQILDLNPELGDPLDIQPGVVIRVPV